MTITAAVACVLVSTAVTPLFFSPLWFAAAAGAVITVAGAGTLTRLRAPACRRCWPAWPPGWRPCCCT